MSVIRIATGLILLASLAGCGKSQGPYEFSTSDGRWHFAISEKWTRSLRGLSDEDRQMIRDIEGAVYTCHAKDCGETTFFSAEEFDIGVGSTVGSVKDLEELLPEDEMRRYVSSNLPEGTEVLVNEYRQSSFASAPAIEVKLVTKEPGTYDHTIARFACIENLCFAIWIWRRSNNPGGLTEILAEIEKTARYEG